MKTKKIIIKILLFSIFVNILSPLKAEDTTPLPYKKDEFPQVLKDLRRFEIISLGAMPFVTLNTSLVYSGIRYANHDFDSNYSPNPFATSTYTTQEQKEILLTALGISIGIAVTDYIVQIVKRNKIKKRNQLADENFNIYKYESENLENTEEITETEVETVGEDY